MYAKLLGGAAVALIIYFGYLYVSNLQEKNSILHADVAKLQLANDALVAEKKQFKENLAKTELLNKELNVEFKKAVESKNAVIRLFSDHNFTKIFNKRPTWIIKKMNAATVKIFNAIEQASKNEE